MKKILCITIFIIHCFLFPFSTYAQGISFRDDAQVNKVSVAAKSLNGKTDIFEYDIHMPVFSKITNKRLEKKLNRQIEKEVLGLKKELEKDAKNASTTAKQNGWGFRPYTLKVTYQVTFNQKGILSFILSYQQYTGGAHGLERLNAYNIHLHDGSSIALSDCFQDGAHYQQLIQQEIIRQIKKNPTVYFPDAEQKVLDTKDFQFYIDDTGFIIYFPLYELAPYASGIRTFSIPFSYCQDMLN